MSNILSSPKYQFFVAKIKAKRLPDNLEAYLSSKDQIERNLLEFLSKEK